MRSYINSHIEKRVYGYLIIQRRSMKIGSVINFSYPSKNNGSPYAIVLNPRFQDKMHCIVIDYMTLGEVDSFRGFIIDEAASITKKDRFIPALRLLSTESQTPESFYRIRLKDYLQTEIKKDVYRTYMWDKIKRLRLVAYQWGLK